MRVNNTPFTVYDFLGYFTPGIFLVSFGIWYFESYSYLLKIFFEKHPKTYADEFFFLFVYMVTCYLTGHLASSLSSIFIENIVRYLYGAPACYLLMEQKDQDENGLYRSMRHFNELPSWFYVLYIPFIFLWFPLAVFKKWVCRYFFNSQSYRNCGPYYPGSKKQLEDFIERKKILLNPENDEYRKEQYKNSLFIISAKLIKYEEEGSSIYNYLTLSGSFRTLAFVFQIIGWSMLLSPFFKEQKLLLLCNISITLNTAFVLGMFVLSFFLTLIYMKFDRRYAEEIITAVIHNNAVKKEKTKKFSCYCRNLLRKR